MIKEFKNLSLYIPTLGRSEKQVTFNNLSPELKKITKLVIHKSEKGQYDDYPHVICPEYEIAPKRKWIVDNCPTRYMAMLDDDLVFDVRKSPDDWRLRHCEDEDMNDLFKDIVMLLENGYAHVGVSARSGNNRILEPIVENNRMMRLLAYDIPVVKKNVEFCRVEFQEDFDICLQLLRKGFPNAILYKYSQENSTFNAAGGCQSQRTLERHNKAVDALSKLHPGFITVRQTKKNSGGDMAQRNEVIIYWKKAFESSQVLSKKK